MQPADGAARSEVVGRVLNCRASMPTADGLTRPETGAPGCGTGFRYRSLAPGQEWDAASDGGILTVERNAPSPPIPLRVGVNRIAARVPLPLLGLSLKETLCAFLCARRRACRLRVASAL